MAIVLFITIILHKKLLTNIHLFEGDRNLDRWHYSATLRCFDISVLQPEMNIPQSVEKGGLLQSKRIIKEIKVNIRICVLKVHMKIHMLN